jgi:kumamolisin
MVPKNNLKRSLIGIIELGGGYTSKDLQNYWNLVGLKTKPIVNSVSVDGAVNNPSDVNSSTEVLLDIEVVGTICPNSIINVYFAPNTYQGFYDAIARAISDNCVSISISWGNSEIYWPVQYMNIFNSLFSIAVKKGITICLASGDQNSSDGTNTTSVDFPGSSPNVLCCGGTKLICPNLVYDNSTVETVWNDGVTNGTGGGYSSIFLAPTYQTNNISNFNSYRGVPDVSANASPTTGIIIIQNGQLYVVGGTSGCSPLWAGFLASIGCRTFANNIIYPLKGLGLHDITVGDNIGYTSSRGWDACSGWGSCNGSILSNKLK